MKVIIDDKIPYIKGALEPFGEVIYHAGSKITPQLVKDADALIVRTRTLCNAALLAGSQVRFIATATIGYDHIDTHFCEKNGISWTNAPGCNAGSVEQYIAAALLTWALEKREKLRDKTIGIVGVGNVGTRVANLCNLIGMKVLLNDPPRARREGSGAFTPLDTVLQQADIVTLHVPLNRSGADATFHLADSDFLHAFAGKHLLINSCRGEVSDSRAIKAALDSGLLGAYIADCWENEPEIDLELMQSAFLATPHIAGYSRDGKANGTEMSIRALSRFFQLGIDSWSPTGVEPPAEAVIQLNGSRRDEESVIAEAVLHTYDIEADSDTLRDKPHLFEQQRGDYPVRREFGAYDVVCREVPTIVMEKLSSMGFYLKNKQLQIL